MEPKSVIKNIQKRIQLARQVYNRDDKNILINAKIKERPLSNDFQNSGLKQFLPKNISFSPLVRPSDSRFTQKITGKIYFSKILEEKIKENIEKFSTKKISVIQNQNLKRETQSFETERIYSSFLVLFSEVDPSINVKGLKINPKDVMINYTSNPEKVLRTIQQTVYYLKNNKISESNDYTENLYMSYSIYLNVNAELLGLSRSLYGLLTSIFEFTGLIEKSQENQENRNRFEELTEHFRAIEKKNEKRNSCNQEIYNSNRNECFSYEKGELLNEISTDNTSNIMKHTEFSPQIKTRPPRISKKYLLIKKDRQRSLSVTVLKQVWELNINN